MFSKAIFYMSEHKPTPQITQCKLLYSHITSTLYFTLPTWYYCVSAVFSQRLTQLTYSNIAIIKRSINTFPSLLQQMYPLCPGPDSKCECQAMRSKLSQTWASSNIHPCISKTTESQIYWLRCKSVSCFGLSHIHWGPATPLVSWPQPCTHSMLHATGLWKHW